MTAEPLPVAATPGPPVDLADTPLTTDAGVAADHARYAARHPDRLVATLLRTRHSRTRTSVLLAMATGILGLAVGTFLLPIGLAVFVVAIVGWVYEYYRGYFAR